MKVFRVSLGERYQNDRLVLAGSTPASETMTIDLTLSHSQVQAYHKCKYYYKLKYVDGWLTLSTSSMNRGTFIHEGLNYIYSVNGDRTAVNDYLRRQLVECDRDILGETSKYVRLLQRYFEEFMPANDQGQTTLALEKQFVVEILSAKGRPFKVQGYIDRIFQHNGRIFIEDFKTLGSASWWTQAALMLDSQLSTYAALAPHIPELNTASVDGVAVTQINCYDYKNGGMEKKSIGEIMRRERSYRTEHEKNNVLIEIANVADEILDQLEQNKPFTKALTKSCAKCDFSEVCQYALRGVNIQPFLEASFKKKDNPLSLQLLEMRSDGD